MSRRSRPSRPLVSGDVPRVAETVPFDPEKHPPQRFARGAHVRANDSSLVGVVAHAYRTEFDRWEYLVDWFSLNDHSSLAYDRRMIDWPEDQLTLVTGEMPQARPVQKNCDARVTVGEGPGEPPSVGTPSATEIPAPESHEPPTVRCVTEGHVWVGTGDDRVICDECDAPRAAADSAPGESQS